MRKFLIHVKFAFWKRFTLKISTRFEITKFVIFKPCHHIKENKKQTIAKTLPLYLFFSLELSYSFGATQ